MYLGPYFYCEKVKHPLKIKVEVFKCCDRYKKNFEKFCYNCGKNEIMIMEEVDNYNDPLNQYFRKCAFFDTGFAHKILDYLLYNKHAYYPIDEAEGIKIETEDQRYDNLDVEIDQQLIEKTTAEFIKKFGHYVEKLKKEFEAVKIKWGILH